MSTLQIRLSDDLRDKADAVLAEIGMDMPTAVRLYLTKVVQTRSIPFTLEAPSVRIEPIEVDSKTQNEMDGIASAWKRRRA